MNDTAPSLRARIATAEDWRTWRDLRLRALADSPSAFGSSLEREQRFTEEDWRARTGGASASAPLGPGASGPSVLVLAGEEPVGMGGGFVDLPGWLHVVAMWTAPPWRGHGGGGLVLEELRRWATERGLRMHLDVTVGNDGARRLYERCGYVPTGETRPLRPGSPHRVERMVLP